MISGVASVPQSVILLQVQRVPITVLISRPKKKTRRPSSMVQSCSVIDYGMNKAYSFPSAPIRSVNVICTRHAIL
jgi:hypothetical protein